MLALLMQQFRLFAVTGFKAEVISGISFVSKNGIRVRVEVDPALDPAAAIPKAIPTATPGAVSS